MNANDVSNTYADSPERMLLFSILLLVAVALLVLSNRYGSKKSGVRPTARTAELPLGTTAGGPWPPHWAGPEQTPAPKLTSPT
jgi:hypothetical protein